MLIVWANDPAEALKKTVGKIIATAGVPHRVVSFPELPETAVHALPPCEPDDLVLALGTLAIKTLGQHGVLRKGSSISSQRNRLHDLPNGAKCIISYSAEIDHVDYACFVDLQTDAALSVRYINTGSLAPKIGAYRYTNDFTDAINYIKARYAATGEAVRVVHDTETLGTDRHAPTAYFVTWQLTCRKGASDVIAFRSREECLKRCQKGTMLWEQMNWLFTSPMVKLIAANGKYDFCWHNTLLGLPLPTNFCFDTTIVGSLLDENRSNSLNTHVKVYVPELGGYDDAFNQKWDKSRMDLALAGDPEGFLTYAGGDTDGAYQVADAQRPELIEDGKLCDFYVKILHPAARAYETVEQVGWCVDVPYYEHLKDELETEIAILDRQMREVIGGRLVAKHGDKDTGVINFTKPSLLIDFMFSPAGLDLRPKLKTATGKPSTAYDHLKMFDGDEKAGPFIKVWKQYQSAQRTKNTYVVSYDKHGVVDGGFLHHLRSDGRFHPNFFMFSGYDDWNEDEGGAVSGRLSVKDPAIQTIPKHTAWAERIRRAFICPPGYRIYAPDYSQGELRIAACRADDETMIDAYRKGIDLHALTGSQVSGYSWEAFCALKLSNLALWESIRQRGKPCNFGLLYGQREEGFMIYAINKYGVAMTLEEATTYRDGFFNLYNRLPDWHSREIKHAYKHGYVRSDLGRIRHVPMIHSPDRYLQSRARRQAINSPIQSVLTDMMLWAAAILWQRGVLAYAPFFGTVHDQALQFVREDHWEKDVATTKEVMENLPFHEVGWTPQLNFPVDGAIGPTLGDLAKLKG